jgi:hypothetical protein
MTVVSSWITVQTVCTHLTGKIVSEAGKATAKKWHFLALFGRFWSGLQCHFIVRWANVAEAQIANLLGFMSIVPIRPWLSWQCQKTGGRRTH